MPKKKPAKKPAPAAKNAPKKSASPKAGAKMPVAKKPAAKSAIAKAPAKPAATKTTRGGTSQPTTRSKPARPAAGEPMKTRIPKSSELNQLHILFKTDLQCRDCCEYLRVRTLEELVQLGPREIVDQLIVPFMRTVEKMRQRLAEVGACLKGDESFLAHYQNEGRGP